MTDLSEQLSPEQEITRAEIAKAFRDTLATVAGKRVLYWILEECAIYRDAYCGENNATNYTLGQQASGRKIIAKLDEVDPRLYPSLLTDMAAIREMDRAASKATADNMENDDADD
ncbi:hypothetical protein IVB18_26250 [Bradyrhizobium sp. 186]|uniref:hypothetical protein n=1 Tax=Bradyrhizobium sp. 186 TaxID=2782654 RepID=UPI0020013406|nr:hypothetical protein [Bradyrhizobium sp. 186]UPK31834.1 hypothetical protein IVB18_26250 [Bradyrhizobium sp. 186]